jgi:hypothetical protein
MVSNAGTSVSIPEARTASFKKKHPAPPAFSCSLTTHGLHHGLVIYRPYRPFALVIPEGDVVKLSSGPPSPWLPPKGGKPEYPPLEGVRGRKKWFAPTSFRNEVSKLNYTARMTGFIAEM